MSHALAPLDILPQPDDVTCGPTCLHAVYGYFGDVLPIGRVIREVEPLTAGGTLAVNLGRHALARGYAATIYTYNLVLFDPTWFDGEVDLAAKLRAQEEAKPDVKLREATSFYLAFLAAGGQVRFRPLTTRLLAGYLEAGTPILTGLSATYLYECAREVYEDGASRYDDVGGEPVGHFVVLSGIDRRRGRVTVSDPLHENPRYGTHTYTVPTRRLVAALYLGALTYDANLLVVEPAATPAGVGPVAREEGAASVPADDGPAETSS